MIASEQLEVSAILGRELREDELATLSGLDDIPPAVATVVAALAARDVILASKYLRQRIPGVRFSMVKAKVEEIMEIQLESTDSR